MGDNLASFANAPASVARLTLEGLLLLVIVKMVATTGQTVFLVKLTDPMHSSRGSLASLGGKAEVEKLKSYATRLSVSSQKLLTVFTAQVNADVSERQAKPLVLRVLRVFSQDKSPLLPDVLLDFLKQI